MNGGTVKSDIEVSDSLTIPVNPIVSVAMITYGHEEFLAPVSYTHLDVYKRQVCNCVLSACLGGRL